MGFKTYEKLGIIWYTTESEWAFGSTPDLTSQTALHAFLQTYRDANQFVMLNQFVMSIDPRPSLAWPCDR